MKVIDKLIINDKPPEYKTVVWIDTSDSFIPKIWLLGEWQPLGCRCCNKKYTGAFSMAFSNAFDIML